MLSQKSWRKPSKVFADINITPLTDVVLVLLIIFIVTTPLIMQSGIKVRLPKAVTSEMAPEKGVTISIASDGKMFLNDKQVGVDDLIRLLPGAIAESTTKMVVINADADVPHGQVVAVLDAARQSGAERLAISTEPKKKKP